MPAFISEWKTDNAGTSNADQITLPLVSGGTYNFTVQWGDGSSDTITSHDDTAVTHTYATAGTYTVEITGTISGWQFANSGDKDKILDVSQWGDLAFGSTDSQFQGCSNLAVTATDAPDLTGTTSLLVCFRDSGITTANLNAWDVSGVTDMAGMFLDSPFNGEISQWDVSSVTTMRFMFSDAPFNGDVSAWDVSSVTEMRFMFRGASFNGDVSAWDVSSVTDMERMFNGSSFSDENYSRALIAWAQLPLQTDVVFSFTNAPYYAGAAAEARAQIATDFGWTISDNGEAAETSYAVVGEVLDGTTPLTGEPVTWTSEQDVELDAVTSALYGEQAGRYALMTTDALTFPNASDVNGTTVTLDSTTFIYEQDVGAVGDGATNAFISQWKTDNAGTSGNDQITLPLVSGGTYDFVVDWGDGSSDTITAHDDAAVTHTYATAGTYTVEITGTISGWRFADGGDKRKILAVSQWGDLAFGSTDEQFRGCSNLAVTATDAPDLTGTASLRSCFRSSGIMTANLNAWDVSSVTNMLAMFFDSPFNGDISAWNVSAVTTMAFMFRDSSFNGDISAWDVSSVTDMRDMFVDSSFNGDVSTWDVSSVTDMERMFRNTPFNGDVSAWDVSSVTNMSGMFRNTPFNGDVSAWDVSSVTDMNVMFNNSSFNGNVSAWDVSSVTNMRSMFYISPFNGDVSAWDVSSVTDMFWMFRDSSLSDENYSRALIAWAQLPLQTGVEFSDTNANYYAGAAAEARAQIANDFGWTISDEGEDTSATSYAVVGEVLDGTTPLTDEPVTWTSEQDVELDAVTSAFYGEQAGRYALMTTDALTFPNASDVNGTTVTLDSTTFIYEQDVGAAAPPAEDHTAVVSQVFPAPLQSASATHTEPENHTAIASQVFPAPMQSATATHAEPESHTATASQVFPAPLQAATATHSSVEGNTAAASQVFPAPLQSATATHAEPENHTASATQVFPAPLQSATASHTSAQGSTASATQVFPAPLQSATATHALPENHSATATQVFPAPLQSALATHTAAASNTASATQVFPAPLQSAVATHAAPESHTATATQIFPAPIQSAIVVHSDRELKPPVRAQISSAQRFTSNTSTTERIQ